MASTQPTAHEQAPPKVYLRNESYGALEPNQAYSLPYGGSAVAYKLGDTMVYGRENAPYAPTPPTTSEGPYYGDDSTLRGGTISELSNDSRSRHSRSSNDRHHRHHRHQHSRRPKIEDPDGYWKVPHVAGHSTMPGPYVTPGGRHLTRTPKKHNAGLQITGKEMTVGGNGDQSDSNVEVVTQDNEDYMESSHYLPTGEPDMSITFLYDVNSAMDEDTLVRLQAHCRAYLAKKRLREEEAVRVIQRAAALYFDPWYRLFLVLRPHLKAYKMEEEIIRLKSELEKYKAMVNVLRYENVAYQDKISRLLTLLDQMHTYGTGKDLVSKLIKELSMAVADHQRQWRSMVSEIPTSELNGKLNGIPALIGQKVGESSLDPVTENSYKMAKENADFYREQLEMLREEVEGQNARISQHYEEKIGVLSERVEQLQNMLTQESFKADRLGGELEAANSQLIEARETEENLNGMVDSLKRELDNYRRIYGTEAATPGTPGGETMIVAKNVDGAYAAAPLPPSSYELLNDRQTQSNAQKKLTGIRAFLAENPEIYETLKDTPLGAGGEYDILSPTTDRMGTTDPSLGQSMSSVFHSQSHIENYNLVRSQEAESRCEALQERLEAEIGYREDVEIEAQKLRDKIANLQSTLRREKDEWAEEIQQSKQTLNRRVREYNEAIEELTKEKADLENRCAALQKKVEELREPLDMSDTETGNEDLLEKQAKLAAENKHYVKELERMRKEFEQYKRENNTDDFMEQLAEKDAKISSLEVNERHISSNLEILTVKLEHANKLLDENEQRTRVLTKERQGLLHRVSQLEAERDTAVREAASATGRASSERETSMARQRELEDLKHERANFQKVITEMKLQLMETGTKAEAEKRALESRLSDLENQANKRETDLKAELEAHKEKVENLQQELSELHKVESATSTDNRHLKRQIGELQDSVENYTRRVAELERRNADLSAEVERARANISASREAAAAVGLLRERASLVTDGYYTIGSGAGDHGTDSVEFSDEEELDGDERTGSASDLRRNGASHYLGVNGTQTVDRYRHRSRQRVSSRPASRSSTYNPSRPFSYQNSTPGGFKEMSPLPPSSTKPETSPTAITATTPEKSEVKSPVKGPLENAMGTDI